jgi:hypothetical protein
VLAEKSGLPAESLHKVINAVFGGPFLVYSNRMMSGSYFQEVRFCGGIIHSIKLTRKAAYSNRNS